MPETQSAGEKVYDFFISYKSENIDVVRPIAEILIANHLRVWFSEYSVDINTYLGTDEILREAVQTGISKARFGICFTNEAYLSSTRCRMELNQFFECLHPDHILQIPLPVPATYAQVSLSRVEIDEIRRLKEKLGSSRSIEFQSIAATLRQIVSVTNIDLLPLPEAKVETSSRRTPFAYNDNDFSLDFSEWRVHNRWAFSMGNGDIPGPRFERRFRDGIVSGHILIGPQDKNITRALSPESIFPRKSADRLYYRKAAEFAQVVVNGLWNRAFGDLRRQIIRGTHLLFLLGRCQMAVTTFSPANETVRSGKEGIFHRLYSIVVPEITDDPDTEIAFFFSFQGSLPAFCQYAYHMDELVLSLRRELISRQSLWRQYWNNLASWTRRPMLWGTAGLLLAAGLTLPDPNAGWSAGAYGFKSAFLLLMALIIGCWSSLQSLRVKGLLSSLFLMTIMLVGGFMGSTAIFALVEELLKSLLGTQSLLMPLFLFGVTIIFLGNLIAFLIVTLSRRIQNTKLAE